MKNLVLMIMISLLFISCNFDEDRVKLNQGLNYQEINTIKNNGFNFGSNNYKVKKSDKDARLHQECTAPCCSEGK